MKKKLAALMLGLSAAGSPVVHAKNWFIIAQNKEVDVSARAGSQTLTQYNGDYIAGVIVRVFKKRTQKYLFEFATVHMSDCKNGYGQVHFGKLESPHKFLFNADAVNDGGDIASGIFQVLCSVGRLEMNHRTHPSNK